MNEEIKNIKDLIEKLNSLLEKKEAFTINATFNSERGVRSVFFIGGKVNLTMLSAHAESFDAMIRTLEGKRVEAESIIKLKDGSTYEKREDGGFKFTFKQNGDTTTQK